jgi:diaminopropionate ammonia-lyase
VQPVIPTNDTPTSIGTTARSNIIARNYNRFTIPAKATVTAYWPARPANTGSERGLFSDAEYQQVHDFFAARPHRQPTPLRDLPALAQALGIGRLMVKDETGRFGLNAFKLLGASFAIETLQAEGALPPGATVVCASEGNHGRAVARAAREAGCQARVYMAADAAQARVDAIAGEGAAVVRVDGSYDDAVRKVSADAATHGWTVVSDTSWDGYERIPRLIMLGYTHMMEEVPEVSDAVFVQGGVGGLLCGIASWCARYAPERAVVSVEPTSAACLLASARAGRPTAVTGPLTTSMAGLRNREVSPLAFESVRSTVSAFLAVDDLWANDAIRLLAQPADGDPAIAAGASGAAALAGLLAVTRDSSMHELRDGLGLNSDSRVLVLVSEGVTDPELWRDVIGGTYRGAPDPPGGTGAERDGGPVRHSAEREGE